MLFALAAVLVVMTGIVNVESTVGPLILIVSVGLGLVARAGYRARSHAVEVGWVGRTRPDIGSIPVVVDDQRVLPLIAPARRAVGRRRVASALGRFESGRMLSSPWFGAGLGFLVVLTVLYGVFLARDKDGVEGPWGDWFVLLPLMAHPMVGMAVVVAHHAVSRGRRDGVEELFAACPTDETTRSIAHLRAGWVPAASVVGFVILITSLFALGNPRVYGPIDDDALAHVLSAIVLALGGTALGVALARWAPWRLVPFVVVAALVPVIVELGGLGQPHWSNARQLSSFPQIPGHDLLFSAAPVWWHLLWLAALVALVSWLALLHAVRTLPMLVVGAIVGVGAVSAGFATTRSVSSADASRLASLVAEPEIHQLCRATERIEVCVYEGYDSYIDLVLAHVAPIAAAAPSDVERITLRQVFDGNLDALGPEVEAALDRRGVQRGDFLPLGFTTRDEVITVARLLTAARAVGLPTEARFGTTPTVIAGEARGVVMLWLAGRGLDPDAAEGLTWTNSDGLVWPDPCYGERSPSVAWSAQDLAAARALLDLPVHDVHRILMDNWQRFTDPATSTDELLVALGLEPMGAPARVPAIPVVCDW